MPQVAIGSQFPNGAATGVFTYGEMLKRALTEAGVEKISIDAGAPDEAPTRAGRWPRALRPWCRSAHRLNGDVVCRDVFREAQVFFDVHRRPMEIVCDGPPGIAHWTYPMPIRLRGWRNVYTFHDIIPLTNPGLSPIPVRRYERMLRAILREADRIVTVSAASKADVDEFFDCAPGFVVNLGQAVDPVPSGALPAGLKPGSYLLHCGSIEPRKNLLRLIAAYSASGVAMPLVLAGPAGWQSRPILGAVAVACNVLHLDYLPRATLCATIAHARAVLMPSLAEGFGLPVAEAMRLGTPVVTSDRGALVETAGGAALLVDPEKQADIAAAIRAVAQDGVAYADLRRRAAERGKSFALAPYAARLRDFYEGLSCDG